LTDLEKRNIVTEKLVSLGIDYKLYEHKAVYTMEEAAQEEENLNLPENAVVVKNLFLKEHNSDKYVLVVTTGEKNADIKALRRYLGTKPLSFATEDQLEVVLGVSRGAVSPLSVINDKERAVCLVIDDELKDDENSLIGVHPNENTSTLLITYKELERYAESTNHMLINMQV
jgi:Ala-tRNA(Pro) deacylase